MGQYINPSNESKELWLESHGTEVEPTWPISLPDVALVCLVQNPMFSAAAVIYDKGEWVAFTDRNDLRPRR